MQPSPGLVTPTPARPCPGLPPQHFLRTQGPRAPGFQGPRVPGFQGPRVLGSQGFRVPGFQCLRVSSSQIPRVPRFQGPWPRSQDFRVPGPQRPKGPGSQGPETQGPRVPGPPKIVHGWLNSLDPHAAPWHWPLYLDEPSLTFLADFILQFDPENPTLKLAEEAKG